MGTVYVVITRGRPSRLRGGYHFGLRDGLDRQSSLMQSAHCLSEKRAREEAERLFGPLRWQAPLSVGIAAEHVCRVAQIEVRDA